MSQIHARVAELLARGQADQDTLEGRLSLGDRAAIGEPDAWSPKDNVAHNNFWRQDALWRLKAAREGRTPEDTEANVQANNERIFREQRQAPWQQLVTETRRLRAQTADLIQHLSPEDLATRDRYPWQEGGSLQTLILVNWYDHPAEHWSDVYLRRHEVERAIELRNAVAATVRELFPDNPRLLSYMLYKVGTVSARGRKPDQAVNAIRAALDLNPALVEAVRTDGDLDPVRISPAFKALEQR